MSNLTDFMGGVVKSVQRGVSDGASSVTISAVDTSKSILLINGYEDYEVDGTGYQNAPFIYAELESATRIDFDGIRVADTILAWQVIEFN